MTYREGPLDAQSTSRRRILDSQESDRDSDVSSQRLRIGLDVAWAGSQPTGTGVYTSALVHALLRHDTFNTYVLYFKDPRTHTNPLWGLQHPTVERRVIGPNVTNVRNQTLAYHLYRDRIDVFHSTGFFLPYGWTGRKVVTIHDVNHLRYAKHWWRPGWRLAFLSLLLQAPLSAWQAQRIIACSHAAAGDIMRYLRVPAGKIAVIPEGIRSVFRPDPLRDAVARVMQRHGLDHYILYVGVMAPQKNLERLIRAFARSAANERAQGGGVRLQLALVGNADGPYTDQVLRPLIRSLGCQDDVIFTGYVSDDDLNCLYVGARCLAQISEGEGFGLPLVEAMACGVPLVASAIPTTVEVAGEAALLVSPWDLDAIAGAMTRICRDSALRAQLRERGLRRALDFTWDKAAADTLDVYLQVSPTAKRGTA